MTIVTMVQETCAVVGVENPGTSVFTNINTNRTMFEMVALANEMSQRIAYDLRDWTMLRSQATLTGDAVWDDITETWVGGTMAFNLPADYLRMTLTGNVRLTTNPTMPLEFISDYDKWIERRLIGRYAPSGEWTILGGKMLVYPILHGVKPAIPGPPLIPAVPAQQVTFPYISKNCVLQGGTAPVDRFTTDTDTWRLGNERVMRLGMIWQWKAQKGSPYAEDMGTYSDALSMMTGKDSPAPIIVGSQNISAAIRTAYPGPLDPAGWTWPLQ